MARTDTTLQAAVKLDKGGLPAVQLLLEYGADVLSPSAEPIHDALPATGCSIMRCVLSDGASSGEQLRSAIMASIKAYEHPCHSTETETELVIVC